MQRSLIVCQRTFSAIKMLCVCVCVLFICQVNAVDSQGLTALHRVAKQGNVQACRLLIQYGADLNIASLQGYTAAQLAPESLQKILKGSAPFPVLELSLVI